MSIFVVLLVLVVEGYGFLLHGLSSRNGTGCGNLVVEECPHLNRSINICSDFPKASLFCQEFCNICPIDGAWSDWTQWSSCPVSCGDSNRTRTRTCDNPAPLNGGDMCPGYNVEKQMCSITTVPCPVNGHWGLWSSWGTCSVTCGSGITRRDRYCNNPYPSSSGEYCYGEGIQYMLCTEALCSTWTSWTPWSPCSNTCGTGLKRRERNCTGAGTDMINLCPGDAHENELCETTCHQFYEETTSAFSARYLHTYSGNDVRFTTVLLNQGGDYNVTTGYFTCRIPGIYHFTLTIQKTSTSGYAYCYIKQNGSNKAYVRTQGSTSASYAATSESIILHLSVNDKVNIGGCTSMSYFYVQGYNNIFSGFLIARDN